MLTKALDIVKISTGLLDQRNNQFALLANDLFKNLVAQSPVTILLINYSTSCVEFLSDNLRDITGYDPSEIHGKINHLGWSVCIPEQQKSYIELVVPALLQSIEEYSEKKQLKKIRLSFNMRIPKKDGGNHWILQQITFLETDENGKPLLGLVFMTDINLIKKDSHIDFNISKINQDTHYQPVYTTNFPVGSEKTSLSLRELEILALMGKGITSKDIADRLNLSVHTINTHRKKMLEKTGAKNATSLYNLAKSKGLL